MMVNQTKQKNRWEIVWAGVIVLLFVVLVLVFGVALVTSVLPVGRWLLVAVVMVVFLIALGRGMSGRLDGILIDSRYKMSLSRFQMTLWTVLVFSAYFTIALPRCLPGGLSDIQTTEQVDACIEYLEDQDSEEAKDKVAEIKTLKEQDPKNQYSDETMKKAQEHCTPGQPLNITFPSELLAALGISTVSLAGSSLIKSAKGRTEISAARVLEASNAVTEAEKKAKDALDKLTAEAVKWATNKKAKEEAEAELAALESSDSSDPDALEAAREKLRKAEGEFRTAQDERGKALTAWEAADEALATAKKNDDSVKTAQSKGSSLDTNDSPEQATWGDMFRFEIAGKQEGIDLTKVQMFFFTIVVVFAYGAAIFGLLAKGAALTNPLGVDFPAFSSSLNALLGLSHAGYLTVKATN
jgi:hypothetical protein